jgi:Holliday junction resolvase RusA-like endonuclease
MLTFKFPFSPPTANHAQKSRIVKGKGKAPYMVRYNTPKYNDFKQQVQTELGKLDDSTRAELVALLQAPHMVFITVASPSVITKKGEYSKTFLDSDNSIKTLQDAIYKHLGANDCYATIPVPNKTVSDETYTQVSWLPFKSWKEKDFILVDHIRNAVEGL